MFSPSRRLHALVITVALALQALASAEPPSYNRDIRPILSDNCFTCHGPDAKARKAKLRLDLRAEAIREAIVPGKADESPLIDRVTTHDVDDVMPPLETKKKLTAGEVAKLRAWINAGAEYQEHWAFLPIARPTVPDGVHGIDHFIQRKLAENKLELSPEADRHMLIRRLYVDLLGLLPTPEEADTFAVDTDPKAYEKLVAQVLESPHYGERWGRHWLDQARYADSDGYAPDGARVMWPYRDWVIRAINDDMPFDQFTIEQLAGDLLPEPTESQLVATGFHRNTLINTEGGSDPEQFRNETVIDRTNTSGAVWLGLTVGCAQCHTHKFDPIEHSEYFELFAFFNSTEDRNSRSPEIALGSEDDKQAVAKLRRIRDALKKTGGKEKNKPLKELEGNLRERERRIPKVMVMRDRPKPRETYIHVRGDFLRKGETVKPGVPRVLPQPTSAENRLDFARWLVDPKNPLTARVTVNRAWMRYFGRGLVVTENDFGTQGTLPSHPDLLDWLATEFVRQGWSMKKLHHLIVTSATYRQSSMARADLTAADPYNFLLGRQQRFRVEAEIVRDLALSASGLLTREIGGPSVYPPQPAGVYAFTQNRKSWKTATGDDRYRRGMYTFFYRTSPHPMLSTFDTPNFQTVCTSRERSNTPLQSLNVANAIDFIEMAQGLAARTSDITDASARIARMFRIALTRPPDTREAERLHSHFLDQQKSFAGDADAAKALSPENPADAAWIATARVLINLDEFVTKP